ncbi:MAG TPA: DUF190 domain-containing protein [Phycisphaerales bacterium]|nr:DUF190 domain-containing protein [Phycisphaerales bacterium]
MSDGSPNQHTPLPERACRLSIYIGESDKWRGRPLYEAIVMKARELHIAGATVLRGPMGFGAGSRIHTAKIMRLSEDLPIVIEIIETREKIEEFTPHLREMMEGGVATVEDVEVVVHQARHKPG